MRSTQKRKIAYREALSTKFVAYKKSLETSELQKLVADLLTDVSEKSDNIKTAELKKHELYSEITGEPMPLTGDGDGTNKLASEAKSEAKSEVKKKEKPVHSASKIATLGKEFQSACEHLAQLLEQ